MTEVQSDRRITDKPRDDQESDSARIIRLEAENKRLKEALDQGATTNGDNTAIALYGEKHEMAVVKERLALAPFAKDMTAPEITYVAQVAGFLRWNPFFDMYAFKNKKNQQITIMPSYQKMVDLVRQDGVDLRSRPATIKEREDYGVKEGQIAFVTEATDRKAFFEYVKAGCAEYYKPQIGIGIWKPGDNVPETWTPEQVARKRSLRQVASLMGAMQIAMRQVLEAISKSGATLVSETDDGYVIQTPAEPPAMPPQITPKAEVIEGEIVTAVEPAAAKLCELCEKNPTVDGGAVCSKCSAELAEKQKAADEQHKANTETSSTCDNCKIEPATDGPYCATCAANLKQAK